MDSSPSSSSSGDSSRVSEWELGLPSADDLTPLSQSLISPFLASAFSIPSHLPSSSYSSAAGVDSDDHTDEFDDAPPAKRRPRLVWTPQLHRRFVEVVARLGIKNAVPKAIVEMMNVEGLTRENVASHLQKYRMFVKRVQSGPDPKPDLNSQQQQQQPATVMMPLFQNYGSYGGGHAGGYYGN